MKAEHRKELQTNSLADMLGRTVRNVRGGSGMPWTKIILVTFLVAVAGIFLWWRGNLSRTNSEMWVTLDNNTRANLGVLYTENRDSNQGKAAFLMLAFEEQYEGVRLVGGGSPEMQSAGIKYLERNQLVYEQLIKDCEGNDEWIAEAKYGLAVATEALTIADPKNLEKAKNLYADLAKGDLGKTGYGLLAARRLEQLSNTTEEAAIRRFYGDFSLNVFRPKANK
jgi:hypothetical protein